MARQLFDAVWVRDDRVVAVRPHEELRPFFQISEECQEKSLSGDPDRIRTGGLCLDTDSVVASQAASVGGFIDLIRTQKYVSPPRSASSTLNLTGAGSELCVNVRLVRE